MNSPISFIVGFLGTILCWYGLCEWNPLGIATYSGGPNPLALAGYWKVMLAALVMTSIPAGLIIALLIARHLKYTYFTAGVLLAVLVSLVITAINANGELAII